jgi:CHAD domain-containing protein
MPGVDGSGRQEGEALMVDRAPLPDWSDLIAKKDAEITALRAENERLATELHIATEWSARVHAGQQEDADTITALRAEVERLRAALEMFACDCAVHERCVVPDNCRNFQACRALTQEPRT